MLLSPTCRGARLARLPANGQLRSWGLPSEDAAHVVAELAANAAPHGRMTGRGFRLLVYVVGTTVRTGVTDTCEERHPRPQLPSPEDENGRGLVIVEALAGRWGVSLGPRPRKTVWAELTVTRSAARR
ncbi:ATP-binding protein [Streptomyces sp. NPDC008092]|uniref:ATP-binding protein n=1 Tax=Streptomyces sp. NPDC008092 TaxID=3364808 RepID=UPI0036E0374C